MLYVRVQEAPPIEGIYIYLARISVRITMKTLKSFTVCVPNGNVKSSSKWPEKDHVRIAIN